MKKIFKIGLFSLLSVLTFVACYEDNDIAPSSTFIIADIVGETSTMAVPGATVSITVNVRASEGISSLTANGEAVEVAENSQFVCHPPLFSKMLHPTGCLYLARMPT